MTRYPETVVPRLFGCCQEFPNSQAGLSDVDAAHAVVATLAPSRTRYALPAVTPAHRHLPPLEKSPAREQRSASRRPWVRVRDL